MHTFSINWLAIAVVVGSIIGCILLIIDTKENDIKEKDKKEDKDA